MKKIMLALAAIALLSGCVSFKTPMVNAKGEAKECEASGGGFGIGMAVGVASAAIARELCEGEQEAAGYLDREEAGTLALTLAPASDGKLAVRESQVPGIVAGDIVLAVNGVPVKTEADFKTKAFGLVDEPVEIRLARGTGEVSLKAQRAAVPQD